MNVYRVGNHQPQNIYRDDTYIGVMFNPADAKLIVDTLNVINGTHDAVTEKQRTCHWPITPGAPLDNGGADAQQH